MARTNRTRIRMAIGTPQDSSGKTGGRQSMAWMAWRVFLMAQNGNRLIVGGSSWRTHPRHYLLRIAIKFTFSHNYQEITIMVHVYFAISIAFEYSH
jgi:hypothetical protein